MSWRLNQELRTAKLAGLLPKLEFTEFAVLLILTDTCRSESRVASISMAELEKLSGQERTQMWRDIKRLIALGLLKRMGGRGNQYQANRYEILLPDAGCSDATSTDGSAGCTNATSKSGDEEVLVASEQPLVASEGSARCIAVQHIPVPGNNYPGERGAAVQDLRPVAAVPDQRDALSLQNGLHQNNGEILGEVVGGRDPNEGKPSFIKIGDRWFPEYCSAHMPDGYDGECKRCGITRRNNERRQERAMEARIAEMVASTRQPPPPRRPPRQLEIEDVVPKPDPDAPVCTTDGCTTPASNGLFCGRCSTHRQLTGEPERRLADGNSIGNGALAATTTISSQEVAA